MAKRQSSISSSSCKQYAFQYVRQIWYAYQRTLLRLSHQMQKKKSHIQQASRARVVVFRCTIIFACRERKGFVSFECPTWPLTTRSTAKVGSRATALQCNYYCCFCCLTQLDTAAEENRRYPNQKTRNTRGRECRHSAVRIPSHYWLQQPPGTHSVE